jgi:hypothetical protein
VRFYVSLKEAHRTVDWRLFVPGEAHYQAFAGGQQ